MRAARLGLVLLPVLVAAAPARAATVVVTLGATPTVTVTAEPGEPNRLTVDGGDGLTRLHDEGAPLRLGFAGGHCEQRDERTVVCSTYPWFQVHVETGDRDDEVLAFGSVPPLRVLLGPGDDRATGGAQMAIAGGDGADTLTGRRLEGDEGPDRLTGVAPDPEPGAVQVPEGATLDGGPGDDVVTGSGRGDWLTAGFGRDELRGGDGDDLLWDASGAPPSTGPVEPDLHDGGAGRDEVGYPIRSSPIRIDLAEGTAGEDRLVGVESASGGSGDDLILGDGAGNRLRGGDGSDAISGGGGDDRIEGDEGGDLLAGGDGRDVIAGGIGNDVVDGGAGDDDDPRAGLGELPPFVHVQPGALAGGAGDDLVRGGSGSDSLRGDSGIDALEGGDGDDSLDSAGDWMRDAPACGGGGDSAVADVGDRVGADCEDVRRRPLDELLHLGAGARPVLLVANGRLAFAPPCPQYGCHGEITVWIGGRRALRARWSCAMEYRSDCLRPPDPVSARLAPWALRLLRRKGSLRAVVVAVLDPGVARGALPYRRRVVLRLPR